jgi:aspartate kinase
MAASARENQAPHVSFERERGVYAIHVTRDVAHAVISVGDEALRANRILEVFKILSDADIPVFLIKMHRTAVTLALGGTDVARVEAALTQAGLKAKMRRDLALVAVRAASMRDLSGVMVAIADALYEAGARLYGTGDSHNSVLCLIEGNRVPEAVRALCRTFRLDVTGVLESSLETEGGA